MWVQFAKYLQITTKFANKFITQWTRVVETLNICNKTKKMYYEGIFTVHGVVRLDKLFVSDAGEIRAASSLAHINRTHNLKWTASKHQDNFHCSKGAMPTRRRGRGQYKVHVTVCYHTVLYWDQTHFSVQHLSSTFHTDFFSNKIASRLFVKQI